MPTDDVGFFSILKIEIDGHFHGGEPVKPWVAEITGTDPKWGLARRFLDPMNDWRNAHKAWSGKVYGRVSHFPLREGHLYEVSCCRGKPSKRYVVREFVQVVDGKRKVVDPIDALTIADGGGPACVLRIPEDKDGASWVSRITGLGTPERIGFVVVDGRRVYRLRPGVYEVVEGGDARLMGATVDSVSRLDQQEAWAWLSRSAA